MAAIASTAVTVLADEGAAERVVLYRIKNVTSADTYNVSERFARVVTASFVTGGSRSDTMTAASVSSTTLTLTLSGMANDTLYLLVKGETA